MIIIFFKWAIHFVYFSSFHMTNIAQILTMHEKSVVGVLGTQTWGSWMVGADECTELWQHPKFDHYYWD